MNIQIITATLNPGKELFQTALSIKEQTHQDWLWRIENGGGICPILKNIIELNDPRIAINNRLDSGIYDAWNNACCHSKADWTIFLGSGDRLADQKVLERAWEYLKNINPAIPRIAFGGFRLISHISGLVLRIHDKNWEFMKDKFRHGKPYLPAHPETFHSAGLLNREEIFDPTFRVAGDVDVMLRALTHSEPLSLPIIVSDIMTGGVSQDPRAGYRIYSEVLLACSRNQFDIPFRVKIKEYIRCSIKYLLWMLVGTVGYEVVKESIIRMLSSNNKRKIN